MMCTESCERTCCQVNETISEFLEVWMPVGNIWKTLSTGQTERRCTEELTFAPLRTRYDLSSSQCVTQMRVSTSAASTSRNRPPDTTAHNSPLSVRQDCHSINTFPTHGFIFLLISCTDDFHVSVNNQFNPTMILLGLQFFLLVKLLFG